MPGVEPAAVDDGGVVPAPGRPGVAFLQVGQGLHPVVEGRAQHEDAVAHLGGVARVAAVLSLGPDQGGVGVGPPLDRARPRRHGVERRRHVVAQRQVGHAVHLAPVHVGDDDVRGEQAGRHDVGIGLLHPRLQDVAPVRRGRDAQDDARLAHRARAAVQRHHGRLAGEVVVEQGLVAHVGQQILISPHRGGAAARLGDDRAFRRMIDVGRQAAPGRNRQDQQARGVRQPGEARTRRRIDHRPVQLARLGLGDIGGPKLQPVGRIDQEGHSLAVRRPADIRQARIGGQARHRARRPAVDRLEAEPRQPGDAAVGRAVVLGIDAIARQPQHRLGQFGDGRQVGAVGQQQGLAVGADADARIGLGVQNLSDRRRRLVIGRRGVLGDRCDRQCQGWNGGGEHQGGQGGPQEMMAHGFSPLRRVLCGARCETRAVQGQPSGLSRHAFPCVALAACSTSRPALRTEETTIFISW